MSDRRLAFALSAACFGVFVVFGGVFWAQATTEIGGTAGAWSTVAGVVGGPTVLPPVVLVVALALAVRGRAAAARFLLVAVVGAGVLMYAARVILQIVGADEDGGRLSDYPSGHSTAVTAFVAAGLAIVFAETTNRVARVGVTAAASLAIVGVSLSRMETGAHALVDVAGGVALGLAWTFLCIAVVPPSGARAPTLTGWLAALLVAATLGLVLLAVAYSHEPLVSVDSEVAERVATSMPRWGEVLALPFTWLGGWVVITTLTLSMAVVLVRERSWLDVAFLVAAVPGSAIAVALLKAWFDRPRPDAGSAIPLPESASFPSGHAVSGIASLGALAILAGERLESPRARLWLWGVALVVGPAVGLSRVVLNVHYVSDVLAGWCLGLAWLAACLLVRERFRASG